MRIDDFIDATNTASTQEEVFRTFLQAADDLGLDRVMYRALRNHPDTILPCVARSYPDDWIAHYVARNYVETDPVRQHCLSSSRPCLWWDLAPDRASEPGRIFREAEEAGLKGGIAVPIHGPVGECVGIGLASTLTVPDHDRRAHLAQAHLLAVQFHTAFSALGRPAQGPPLRLTPREREVLSWCAQGKSAWVIGQILNIAEHSVEWHLKNIFRKLNVDNRIGAVVKALNLGLITL